MSPRLLFLLLLPLFDAGEGAELEDRLTSLEKGFDRLAYQVMSQQLYVEETARSSSTSGVKQSGTAYRMDSSGIRTLLPDIPGVGVLRTRYPIMPVSTEGNAIWKELHAIRDTFTDMKHHLLSFPTRPPLPEQVLSVYDPLATHSYLTLKASDGVLQNVHTHFVNLSRAQFEDLKDRNQTFFVHTTRNHSHSHELLVHYNRTS